MLPDELEKRLDGIEDASKKGYPVRNLYKIACEPGLWLQAYVNIRANAGALTQGVSTDTIDGFSIERAEKLAKTLRSREYVAKPVRRVQIPKKDGKTRPLGIPGGDDKLAQEVARIILERVYEPVFSERHCCKVSDEAAFCLIQRPYISKTLLTRRISPRGSP
ncbi:hypothetical protein QS272_24750 [Escherichia coli]|nr:hypothetical protein [Escherichia coli]MDL8030272.1 hypothetical protein [Escherichia coli]MDL8035104.1 hypothetical protein [Escherichia coli]MDL8050078.1 hypothetical protein [Escherichia coli]MDL9510465.1 hypothetical protein [Escherichia coli]